MATERKVNPEPKFVRGILPWLIALAILVLYLLTLNRWVSFGNLEQVSNVSGWSWYPQLFAPVNYLLTLPIRWLPPRVIPLALNMFSAVCAALSLALLARSVALLPHDRTHEQREKERGPLWLLSIPAAWVPPVVAVLACGLELTFWEYATSCNTISTPWGGGSEMLDLLLFAYVLRCLLEFRLDQRESWLFRAAVVYGAAMADNWAMIGFFPLLLVALIWIRGLAFFNTKFLLRLFLTGCAGLSLYLLLPIVQSFADFANVPFWPALKINLGGQLYVLKALLTKWNLFYSEKPFWIMGIYSLLPMLALGIKWPSYFGDTSKLGVAIATFTFHLVHGILLLLCAWVALDPPVAPRVHAPGLPFLTLYYLTALNLGYLIGYFLLLFGPQTAAQRRAHPFVRFAGLAVTGLVCLICLFLPVALIYKNLPQIRVTNGPAFKDFSSLLAQHLPAKETVVLSDDRRRLLLLQAYTARTGADRNLIFLDTSLYKVPDYHRFLKKKHSDRWPVNAPKGAQNILDPLTLASILYGLSATNELYYLHPSFGYFFEVFNPETHGMTYKLTIAPTNVLRSPQPSPELIKENETFWDRADTLALKRITDAIAPPPPSKDLDILGRFLKAIHVAKEPNRELSALAQFYSRSLDYWGVELQRAGDVTGAANHFEQALRLNPENLVASINLRCGKSLAAGRPLAVGDPQAILDEFGKFRGWNEIMNEDGPFDDPTFCFAEACHLAGNALYRQSIQQLERLKVLAPAHLESKLMLAGLYVAKGLPAEALKIVEWIHAQPDVFPITRTNQSEVMFVETSAKLANKDLVGAQETVNEALQKYPEDQQLISTAVRVYMDNRTFTNAIPLIERQLQASPTNTGWLLTNGVANLEAERYDAAIQPFTLLLSMETNAFSELHNTALLNRAIAYLKGGKLEESRQDYEALQKMFPTSARVYYGLGEIAYQLRETNAAIRNYQLYLTNGPTNPDEINKVSARLKELRPGYP